MEQRIAASTGATLSNGHQVAVPDLDRDLSTLHLEAFWLCVAIALVVVAAMIYSLVKFRRSQGAVPGSMLHSTKVELFWTVLPVLILVLVAIPAAELILKMEH